MLFYIAAVKLLYDSFYILKYLTFPPIIEIPFVSKNIRLFLYATF